MLGRRAVGHTGEVGTLERNPERLALEGQVRKGQPNTQ